VSRAAGRIDSTVPGYARPPEQETDLTMSASTTAATQPPSTTTRTPRAGARVRAGKIVANLSTAALYEAAIRDGEGLIAAEGPLVVSTGTHTGRSPKDKFIVREPSSEANIWWGDVNHEISEEHYDKLRSRLMAYLADRQRRNVHALFFAMVIGYVTLIPAMLEWPQDRYRLPVDALLFMFAAWGVRALLIEAPRTAAAADQGDRDSLG